MLCVPREQRRRRRDTVSPRAGGRVAPGAGPGGDEGAGERPAALLLAALLPPLRGAPSRHRGAAAAVSRGGPRAAPRALGRDPIPGDPLPAPGEAPPGVPPEQPQHGPPDGPQPPDRRAEEPHLGAFYLSMYFFKDWLEAVQCVSSPSRRSTPSSARGHSPQHYRALLSELLLPMLLSVIYRSPPGSSWFTFVWLRR